MKETNDLKSRNLLNGKSGGLKINLRNGVFNSQEAEKQTVGAASDICEHGDKEDETPAIGKNEFND